MILSIFWGKKRKNRATLQKLQLSLINSSARSINTGEHLFSVQNSSQLGWVTIEVDPLPICDSYFRQVVCQKNYWLLCVLWSSLETENSEHNIFYNKKLIQNFKKERLQGCREEAEGTCLPFGHAKADISANDDGVESFVCC